MGSSLTAKLQLKEGQRLTTLNPPEGYVERLARELPEIRVHGQCADPAEAVLLFVSSLGEAERLLPEGIRAVKGEGLLWVAYPKGSSGVKTDINRDTLWEASKPTGWRPVRQVAVDEVWSAIRFRPAERLGR